MKAINNIDAVRIPLRQGTDNQLQSKRIYLPYSTSYQDKVVNQMVFLFVPSVAGSLTDPATGRSLPTREAAGSMYVTLKDPSGRTLFNNFPLFFAGQNNWQSFLHVNSLVDWQNSYISVPYYQASGQNEELLIYFTYDGGTTTNDEADYMTTRTIDIDGNFDGRLSDIMDGDWRKLSKIVTDVPADNYSAGWWLTLKDQYNRTFDTLSHLLFCRATDDAVTSPRTINVRFLDDFRVDFTASRLWVQNNENQKIKITLFFQN